MRGLHVKHQLRVLFALIAIAFFSIFEISAQGSEGITAVPEKGRIIGGAVPTYDNLKLKSTQNQETNMQNKKFEIDNISECEAQLKMDKGTSGVGNAYRKARTIGTEGELDGESLEEVVPLKEIKVYPVPANDFVTIDLVNVSTVDINIFDFTGKLVYTGSYIDETKVNIDVFDLKEGCYLVRIVENGDVKTKKIQVAH